MNSRRRFLQHLSTLSAATAAGKLIIPSIERSFQELNHTYAGHSPSSLADNEDFWYQIQQMYTVSANVMNLNNGGVSPQPRVVQEAVERYNRLSNEAPSYYMWRVLDKGREPLREKMATLAGCSPEEIAFDRNSSEALETIIFGLRLNPGDEVVLTRQDYPNMINAWKQRAKRDGITLKWINFDFPIESKQTIVNGFVNAFSDKTRVVHITHMINWMGQLLPASEIAEEAHKRNIEVVVDAAHSFAHINYKIPDLKCDYFGTSLHKWLCAPFGSGLLYVKKDKIKRLYPLLAAPDPESEDIRKFEHLGTRSFAIEQAIGQALQFHNMIGSDRKEARLLYLKNYWAEKARTIPGVSIHTSLDPEFSGAICLVKVEGKTPQEISAFLFNQYKIHTVAIDWENINGVRITPNVYTVKSDLDRLLDALQECARS